MNYGLHKFNTTSLFTGRQFPFFPYIVKHTTQLFFTGGNWGIENRSAKKTAVPVSEKCH